MAGEAFFRRRKSAGKSPHAFRLNLSSCRPNVVQPPRSNKLSLRRRRKLAPWETFQRAERSDRLDRNLVKNDPNKTRPDAAPGAQLPSGLRDRQVTEMR
jgi:hypothetical protein